MIDRAVSDAEIEACRTLVYSIANRLRSKMKLRVEVDELAQAGMVGLLEAANRFDPESGVAFSTFAYTRVRGSIVDSLSGITGIRRSQARQLARLKSANEFVESLEFSGQAQTPEEFVSRAVSGAMFAADFGELTENVAAEALDENDTSPLRVSAERALGRAQLRALMLESLGDLADDEAAILRGHYLDGVSLRELADRQGISRSWASRVHTRALKNAQSVLRKRYKVSLADLFDAPKR